MRSCDTNIFAYALNQDCPEHKAATSFLDEAENDTSFVVCELVLLELYALLRNQKVFKHPFSAARAAAICQAFRSNPKWRVIDYEPAITDTLWQYAATCKSTRQIFDIRIALTLHHHGVKAFATRNVKDFKFLKLFTVSNPL